MPIHDENNRVILIIGLIILLILAVARTHYGIWNADIPLGDESGHVGQAFQLYENGQMSHNIYHDVYVFFFKHITTDPIIAYYFVRFIASLLSIVGLFLLLSSLSWVSPSGAYIMSLVWNINVLCTPPVQYGNISIFAFALACFGGYLWLAKLGKSAQFFSLVIFLIVIAMRPEYALLLFLLGAQRTLSWLKKTRDAGLPRERRLRLGFVIGIFLFGTVVIATSANCRSLAKQYMSSLDSYLFLGLEQCYTYFDVTRDSSLKLEPFTEYDSLMRKHFPGASGFFEAVSINPREIARYFILNAFSNMRELKTVLSNHNILLTDEQVSVGLVGNNKHIVYKLVRIEQLTFYLVIMLGGIWIIKGKISKLGMRDVLTHESLVFLLSLASVIVSALLLHRPDPRYYIMLIPLLFWGPAALVSDFLVIDKNRTKTGLLLLVALIFSAPVFPSTSKTNNDKDVVLALRDKIPPGNPHVKALGIYPEPLLTFSIPGRWEATNNMNVRQRGVTYEHLVTSKKYDLFIIDEWLKSTQQYHTEKTFFDRFDQFPEAYGYELLLDATKTDGPIRIYRLMV